MPEEKNYIQFVGMGVFLFLFVAMHVYRRSFPGMR